jgi:hypothetical protein
MKANRRVINRGWFRPGRDHRRHQLTREERRAGGKKAAAIASCKQAATMGWGHQFSLHVAKLGFDLAAHIFTSGGAVEVTI